MRFVVAQFALVSFAALLMLGSIYETPASKPGGDGNGQPSPKQQTTVGEKPRTSLPDTTERDSQTEKPKENKQPFMTHAEWINSTLTLSYVIVSILVLWAIKGQSKIAARQLRLQEIAQRQWLNFEATKIEPIQLADIVRLEIIFQIANRTDAPLTRHSVSIRLDTGEKVKDARIALLVPYNPYVAKIAIPDLSPEQLEFLKANSLELILDCTVIFRDASGRDWEQEFGRKLRCGISYLAVSDTVNSLREYPIARQGGN
jgi:hypothetical protein